MEKKILPFYTNYLGQWSRYYMKDPITNQEFNCAEQYMMYTKALLFEDLETANSIIDTDDPKEQKALGRIVKRFDKKLWDVYARDIVYSGNYLKFSQNNIIFEKLLATKDSILVEASPYDLIWGVGIPLTDNNIYDRKNWKGKNWLGEVLTQLRDDFISGSASYYTLDWLLNDDSNIKFK